MSYSRSAARSRIVKDSGPYEAIVVNNLDKRYMGALEVEILKYTGSTNTPEKSGEIVTVRYLSPFYGVTPSKGINENDGYENTQKSYGFWAVPPDIGAKVLVIFAEGNINFGYWIGCIQDDYMNFMVPDGRPSTFNTTDATPNNLKSNRLPAGEYNKLVEDGIAVDPTFFKKPYNKDFTNVLEVQGLLEDEIRGTTTSSARREIPSMVFGISTPGPLDKRKGNPRVELGPKGKKANMPFNRLGGSSIVMDDGDDKLVRKTHAEDGPPIYVNKAAGETGGDETIPHNELFRIRTRTGHQILLHNSEDLIYIANSRGTAWIELSSDGKIDIHAQDSISIMSDNDINFTAERDFNVEAGRNINMKATARWSDRAHYLDNKESGRIQLESVWDTNIHVSNDYKLTVKGNKDVVVDLDSNTTVKQTIQEHALEDIRRTADKCLHDTAKQSIYRTAHNTGHDYFMKDYFIKARALDQSIEDDVRVTVGYDYNEEIGGDFHSTVKKSINIQAVHDFIRVQAEGVPPPATELKRNLESEELESVPIKWKFDVPDPSVSLRAEKTFHLNSKTGMHLQDDVIIAGDAAEIHWNSGLSIAGELGEHADPAYEAIPANPALDAEKARILSTITLPYVFPSSAIPVPYESIVPRAPQHEPWGQHENLNPLAFKKEQTDREDAGALPVADRMISPDPFNKNFGETRSRTNLNSGSGGFVFDGGVGDGVLENGAVKSINLESQNGDITVDKTRGNPNDPSQTFFEGDGPLATVTAGGKSCQVAEVFKDNFQGFLDDLVATGYEIKTLLGYSKRPTVSGSSWSVHASGAAIDINPPNPVMNTWPNGFFSPRPANAPMTDMPANTLELANKWGLGWGGAWRSIDDAMHFSAYKGEGGAFSFRKGFIPKGPSSQPEDDIPPRIEEDLTLPDPPNQDPKDTGPQIAKLGPSAGEEIREPVIPKHQKR